MRRNTALIGRTCWLNEVPILRKSKIIFVHVPKNGGTAVKSWFSQKNGEEFEGEPHLFLDEYVKAGVCTEKELAECRKYAVVRNPWDRMVSAYHFLLRKHPDLRIVDFATVMRGIIKAGRVAETMPWSTLRSGTEQTRFWSGAGKVKIVRFEDLEKKFPGIGRENATPERRPYQDYYTNFTLNTVYDAYSETIDQFGYSF
jgi:hypothetical protein